jgi:hypothetical protein
MMYRSIIRIHLPGRLDEIGVLTQIPPVANVVLSDSEVARATRNVGRYELYAHEITAAEVGLSQPFRHRFSAVVYSERWTPL